MQRRSTQLRGQAHWQPERLPHLNQRPQPLALRLCQAMPQPFWIKQQAVDLRAGVGQAGCSLAALISDAYGCAACPQHSRQDHGILAAVLYCQHERRLSILALDVNCRAGVQQQGGQGNGFVTPT